MSAALALLWLASAATAAEPATESLADRFSRAVRLYQSGDPDAALREFEAIQRAKASPSVLFNIAFCRAKIEDPVGAIAAIDELVANPGNLEAARLLKARELREAQANRVATLSLSLPADAPEPISVEVDGVTHLVKRGESLQLNPGRHQVTVLAPGSLPWRQLVDATAGQPVNQTVELLKSELKPAQLRLDSKLAAVKVELDGRPLGQTPFRTAQPVKPGEHELSLSREGYLPKNESLTLAEGAHETLDVTLAADPSAVRSTLSLRVSEPGAVITVDSEALGDRPTLSLPPGPHQVRIERDGYFPAQREVKLDPGGVLELPVTLEPLPSTLSLLERSESLHRFWGWLGAGVGAAAIVTGVIIFAANEGNLQRTYQQIDTETANCAHGSSSDPDACFKVGQLGPQATAQEQWRLGGLIPASIGLAALAAGILTLYTAPDLERYHRSDDTLSPLTLQPLLSPNGVGLAGKF